MSAVCSAIIIHLKIVYMISHYSTQFYRFLLLCCLSLFACSKSDPAPNNTGSTGSGGSGNGGGSGSGSGSGSGGSGTTIPTIIVPVYDFSVARNTTTGQVTATEFSDGVGTTFKASTTGTHNVTMKLRNFSGEPTIDSSSGYAVAQYASFAQSMNLTSAPAKDTTKPLCELVCNNKRYLIIPVKRLDTNGNLIPGYGTMHFYNISSDFKNRARNDSIQKTYNVDAVNLKQLVNTFPG